MPTHLFRRAASLAVALSCSALLAPSCKVYPHSLLDPIKPPFEYGEGVGPWSGKNPDACFTAYFPTDKIRPTVDDTDLDPIYFGLKTLYLGSVTRDFVSDSKAWQDFGLDLDGICTDAPTCSNVDDDGGYPLSCANATGTIPPDGNDCRDNTFGELAYAVANLQDVGMKYHLNDDTFDCGLCFGRFNFIIKVSGYNGEADDADIRVDLYASPGLPTPVQYDCSDTGWRTAQDALCWKSTDPWLIETAGMNSPAPGPDLPDAAIADADGYVKDNYLVAHLPAESRLWFPVQPTADIQTFPLILRNGTATGKISHGTNGWTLTDGTIAGATTKDDLVSGFRRLGLCEQDPNYTALQLLVAANLDINSDLSVDPDSTCDAISVGLGFEAREATAGQLADTPFPEECVGVGGAGGAPAAGGSAGSAGAVAGSGGASAAGSSAGGAGGGT